MVYPGPLRAPPRQSQRRHPVDVCWVNVSHLLAELEIGFEEIDDGLWNVYFGPVWLGRFHEAVGRIVDQLGRPARRSDDNHNHLSTKVTYHLDRSGYRPCRLTQ